MHRTLGILFVTICFWTAVFVPPSRAQTCKTTRVSVGAGGVALGSGGTGGGYLSSDGRRILFSVAENPYPTSPVHAYVRDETTGTTTELPGPYSDDISGDGRLAIWDGAGIFVTDMSLGTTVRVDVDDAGQHANGLSLWGRISEDGRYVAFMSTSSNLVPNDTNGHEDIFVRDLQAGVTERVSVSTSGAEGDAASWSTPAISEDGRFVAFVSQASNLVPGDGNGDWDVFVRDRATGTTTLVSQNPGGTTSPGISWLESISGDGRFVAFHSLATDLIPGDTNGTWDALVRDTVLGTTTLIGMNADGSLPLAGSYSGPLSRDGRFAVFSSTSRRILPGDAYPGRDVYVRDTLTGLVRRVDVTSEGGELGDFWPVDITPDGRFISIEAGYAIFVRGCPQDVTHFAEAKENSAGCRPWVTWTGQPSASAGSGFVLEAHSELNRRAGRLMYSYQWTYPNALPYLVLAPPIRRLSLDRTKGSPSGVDCTGHLEVDFNAWIARRVDPGLVPGVTVYAQFWTSDDGFPPPGNYGLTDAIDLTILP